MTKMTTEEAFIKVLQMHGIEHAFGIIGSAFMPISDLFPEAGITFWDVAHETNGGLIADGYTRATGKMSMVIAQNGPGITGLVTPIKSAYWNHTPLLVVTPQAANKTMGQGGFQEVEQMNLFKDMVCYQEEVRDPSRMAEVLNRVIEKAFRGSAPAQINVPRDYWTQVIDIEKINPNQDCNCWIMENDKSAKIQSKSEIPLGHKIAMTDLNEGDTILKYGHDLGKVVKSIKKGEHVHVHNVKTKKW